MITGEMKSKIDRIWNTMWSGGISNPLSVIEQLTYLLFIKGLDELHTRKERKAERTGKPIEEPVFAAHQDALRWSRFKELAPEQMFETVRDRVFPFIKALGQTEDSNERSTYSHHMQDAIFMMPTARVLANVVDQLDDIDMADRDTKGDLYEYMLGKIATAGQNGQFRTPRHIIKLMVDMTAPTPNDVVCDPACGTAGFLVGGLVPFLDKKTRTIVYTDFRDEITAVREDAAVYLPKMTGVQYEKKVQEYLKNHLDHIVIHRLRTNQPLTATDLRGLEQTLVEIGEDDGQTLLTGLLARSDAPSLVHFVRSMVGMDRAAAQEVFSEFLSNRSLTTPQIRFVEMVIDQLTARGVMEPSALYEAPFSSVHAGGPEALFAGKSNVIDAIFEKLKALQPELLADAG